MSRFRGVVPQKESISMKFASILFVLLLVAGTAGAAELTSDVGFRASVVIDTEDGSICFQQAPGTCDIDGFISAIVSQMNVSGTNCGTYGPPPPMNQTADEYVCADTPNGLRWWGTYFGAGWLPSECPAQGAAATFNYYWYVGGTPCPDPALFICAVTGHSPDNAVDLGDNDWEYDTKFTNCGVPAGIFYVSIQINEDAYPQWGWSESADNLIGGDPCLIAPGFGITDWIPVSAAVGAAWCGEAFEVQGGGEPTPTHETTWGQIKSTFQN
jgi:hypothetical protein